MCDVYVSPVQTGVLITYASVWKVMFLDKICIKKKKSFQISPMEDEQIDFFLYAFYLSSDITFELEANSTEALLTGMDTPLLRTRRLTETRDPCKDLTTSRETLVTDCTLVAFNADINFSTPWRFEPRSRQCRRKINTTRLSYGYSYSYSINWFPNQKSIP